MKDRSAAGSVGKAHFATEPVNDLLDDAQAKSATALLPRGPGIGLRKFLEDERLEVDWDARTMVANRKTNHVSSFLDRDHHLIIRWRELDCVRK